MKKLFVLSFLLVAIFSASHAARADQLTLTGVSSSGFAGYAAGPYYGSLNGHSITMVCDSFDRHNSIGQTWQVSVNSFSDLNFLSNVLYGGQVNALAKYRQAAWLYDQLLSHQSQAGDIQGAIWNLFNPTITPDTLGSNVWLALAQAQNFAGYDFSKYRFLTPLDRTVNGQQEMITTTPEPATLALLGTGLAGVASTLRKRRRESQKAQS